MTSLVTLVSLSAPGRGPAPALPSPVKGAPAPWHNLLVENCKASLEQAGARKVFFLRQHRVRTVKKKGYSDLHCHVPQRLRWVKGPGKIKYSGYVNVNCRMALALAKFETIVQRTARQVFGAKKRVEHIADFGSYNCRRIRGYPEMLSEHSFGNALDVARFRVRGWGTVSVLKHWKSKRRKHRKAREFLHALVAELRREKVFSTVLTPEYDYGHRNHLHLDLNHIRWGSQP